MRARTTTACVIVIMLVGPRVSATAAPWQTSSSTSCPEPSSPLSQIQVNVDREVPSPMTEDNKVAHLEVASAYAAQKAGNGVNWCVRYEVTNNGPDAVPLFYWRLMGQKLSNIDELTPSDGLQSVLLTLTPGRDPVVKETVLNGFKWQSINTKAYQSAETPIKRSLITLVASGNGTGSPSSSSTNSFGQTFALEKDGRLPEVGGEFTGAGADIGAVSTVTRDNDVYHFNFQLGRNDGKSVQSVLAPLTLAFAKLQGDVVASNSPLESVLKDVESSELHLQKDVFDVRMDLPVASVQHIYVVFQPITFKRPNNSRVCFLASTYSPINIPQNWLSCH